MKQHAITAGIALAVTVAVMLAAKKVPAVAKLIG